MGGIIAMIFGPEKEERKEEGKKEKEKKEEKRRKRRKRKVNLPHTPMHHPNPHNTTHTIPRVYNREREYPTVNMSPESNVTFDHSHVMHVHVHWSVLFF